MSGWDAASLTETGKVRAVNEDAVLDHGTARLWAVADGMGGHKSGDYASLLVADRLRQFRCTRYRGAAISHITRILDECNSHLVAKAASENGGIIGCTVAVLTIHQADIVCSWSGDSRIYRLRDGALTLLTRDHNYGSLCADRDLNFFPDEPLVDSQLLTGAIGGNDELALEHCWYGLKKGDAFLLCTDGLYKEVSEDEIGAVLDGKGTLQRKAARLVELYNEGGARDNIGIVLVSSD